MIIFESLKFKLSFFLQGGELFDYILKHHYLQETEAKRLFAQLISGVHYMHQKHIVHRDLKLVIFVNVWNTTKNLHITYYRKIYY